MIRRGAALFGVLLAAVVGSAKAAVQEFQVASRGPRFMAAGVGRELTPQADEFAVLRRRVTLALDSVPLDQALKAIVKQTDLEITYSRAVLPTTRSVSLHAQGITVAAALTEVLLDLSVDVSVARSGHLALVPRARVVRRAPSGNVVGWVTDANTGKPLLGTEVLLNGTAWRTVSDSNGRYRLADVDSGSYTLVARRLGYTKLSQKVFVHATGEDTVNVVLTPAAVALNELVATATGQQRRRDIGNSITTIQADSVLRSAPIRNLTDLLENRVPGLSVQHTSGAPGDPARMRLRGLSSVMRGNDPVVVVDGVRIYSAQSAARSGNLTNMLRENTAQSLIPAPSPLDQIDPNIIDKIEVFKGPSAATLYGADAANGVIVITTKKGKAGPTRWDVSSVRGRTTPAGRYPEGYYRWGHSPATGEVMICPLTDRRCVADSLTRYQALNDPDMSIFGEGQRTALSLTASGGSQALTYSVTGSYADETGLLKLPDFEIDRFQTTYNRLPPEWMRQPWRLKTWSVMSRVTALLGPAADVTLSSELSRSEQQRTSLENQQAQLAHIYVDKSTGNYYRPAHSTGDFHDGNYTLVQDLAPLNDYYERTTASTLTFRTGLTANWKPRSWFAALGRAGVDVVPRDDESFLPAELSAGGQLQRGTGRSLVSTVDMQGTLRRPLRWGFTFETNFGVNLVTVSTNDFGTFATNLIPGTSSLDGAGYFRSMDACVNTSVFGWYIEPRIAGQRLSLSTGIRLDGGSTYGARLTRTGGGLFGGVLGLPKLNGSWAISEESWFPFRSLFSSLRLRGAYGQAQVQPGPADRLRLYARRASGSGDLLELETLGNVDLRPERSTEFEGGFDGDLFDGRLSVEFTGYRKLQVDALMPVTLPGSVHGGGTIIRNVGNIRNVGMDFVTRITPVQSTLLTWSAELQYNRNTNTLVKLGPGVESDPRNGVVEGYPVGGRWALPILGYADANGDGVIDGGEVQVGDSLVFMGRLLPAYKTSLFSNVVLFGGAIGVTAGFSYDAGATQVDQTVKNNWVMNRALSDPSAPLIQQAAVVVADSTDYGITQNVSTFRFSSFAVTYRAPRSVARLLRTQRLSVSLQGSNLGMHSTYRGKDPNVTAWSPSEYVVDTGQIALPRTWQLMMSLQF